MYLETDDLNREDFYELCCKLYRELRKEKPDVDTMTEEMEMAGFSLKDAETIKD